MGTGEALNEHVVGAPWPEAERRLEMLEEAGVAELFVPQIGSAHDEFFAAHARDVVPKLNAWRPLRRAPL